MAASPTKRGLRVAPFLETAPIVLSVCIIALTQSQAFAQSKASEEASGLITTPEDAGEGDEPKRRLVSWNEYEGPYFTLRVGGGLLYDYADYIQDDESEEQLDLVPTVDLRDFRFLLKGRLKFLDRVSYTLGYMYDKSAEEWAFRQTGFLIDVPELMGNLFIGRTKEGFSTSKIMVGYQGWTNERATINDAFLPILADGLKWTGTIPSGKLVYNFGWFGDSLSQTESFNKNDMVVAARAVWLPLTGESDDVLHLAIEGRFGDANDGFLRYRSRPEVFQAQTFAIDTGSFPAQHSNILGLEAYYRPGPWVFGMEYFFNWVASDERSDPFFHGGEIFAAYTLTGEVKPYHLKGAYFERLSPDQSVFEGGIGAWEAVLRFSYSDLDDGIIQGGKFWRITPMMNWHLSDNVRLEFVYGYGMLDRFDLEGGTHFFQSRIQFQL
jgi:phosphate-selective porin OprO/OprP